MKIAIIYTFLLVSGVNVEADPYQPLIGGRAVKTMAACEEYAAESVQNMIEAITASQNSPMLSVSAVCVRLPNTKPPR